MRYYRCKCGESIAWSSMGIAQCDVCKKCGSTLAEGPSLHHDPVPHVFQTKYNEDTGKPYEFCINCYRTKEELEKKL